MPLWASIIFSTIALFVGVGIGISANPASSLSAPVTEPVKPAASAVPAPPVSAAPPVVPATIVFAGSGEEQTAKQAFAGGDYSVSWTTGSDCFYAGRIRSDAETEDAFSADDALSGTTYIYGLPAGDYYMDMNTGPAPGCPWNATFTPSP
jgi:hypothetical protein